MLYFSLTRILFLAVGVAFIGFSILFKLSRDLKKNHLSDCVLFLSVYGAFFLVIGFWENLEGFRLVAHFLSLATGLALVPIGIHILSRLLGGSAWLRQRIRITIVATAIVYLVCNGMFVAGCRDALPLTICYGYAFISFAALYLIDGYKIGPFRALPRHLKFFMAIVILDIALLAAMSAFEALWIVPGQHAVWVLLALFFVAKSGLVYRYPQTFRIIEDQSKAARSRRSLLRGVDIRRKLIEIDRIMRGKEAFRDPDLSLEQLAKLGQLSPHQLSELLNAYAKLNFSEYLSQYRVEQAKRELMDPRCGTILDIAFSCGFNAKSTFNQAFLKATGLTPSAYRAAERARATNNPAKGSAT